MQFGSLMQKARGLFADFSRSKSGTLPVIFAIAVIPALGLAGTAVDYAGARQSKASLQSAADAAALEAVTAAERFETAAGNSSDFKRADTSYKPIERATDLFNALATGATSLGDVNFTIEVSREGDIFRAKATYKAEYKNRMPTMITGTGFMIEGISQSTVAVQGSGYMEVYTLLDTSSSMGIGASKSDIDILKKELGCAFSCHGEKPKSTPVQLRIDVMRDAVNDMINAAEAEWIKDQDEAKKGPKKVITPRIKVALNKFDHEVFEIEPLTADYKRLRDDVDAIKLHPWSHRGTNAKRAIDFITPKVPATGTGMSADSPRRFVFIVTDGLQDRHPSWYPINFPAPFGAGDRTGGIDPAACNALKAKGVTVAILYTTHVGIPGYEWYWQNSQPAIRPNLQGCASPNFFFEAKDAAALSSEFKKMFQKAIEAAMARLEK